jgi:hypothetical protein
MSVIDSRNRADANQRRADGDYNAVLRSRFTIHQVLKCGAINIAVDKEIDQLSGFPPVGFQN